MPGLKIFFALLLMLLFAVNSSVVAKQRVKIRSNGYCGVLYHKLGNTRYPFYIHGKDTTIEMQKDDGAYVLDNGEFTARSAFGVVEDKGKFYFSGPDACARLTLEKDIDGMLIPTLSLNTRKMTIRNNNLTLPYWVSAFKLKSGPLGRTYFTGNVTLSLIVGLDYSIDNGSRDVVNLRNNAGDAKDVMYTAFYFNVDSQGWVYSHSPAATGGQGDLSFNVDIVELNPYYISGNEQGRLRLPDVSNPYHFIQKPTKVVVFRYLANMIFWSAPSGTSENTFIFRQL